MNSAPIAIVQMCMLAAQRSECICCCLGQPPCLLLPVQHGAGPASHMCCVANYIQLQVCAPGSGVRRADLQDGVYQSYEDLLPYSQFSVRFPRSRIPAIVKLLSDTTDQEYLQLRAGVSAAPALLRVIACFVACCELLAGKVPAAEQWRTSGRQPLHAHVCCDCSQQHQVADGSPCLIVPKRHW